MRLLLSLRRRVICVEHAVAYIRPIRESGLPDEWNMVSFLYGPRLPRLRCLFSGTEGGKQPQLLYLSTTPPVLPHTTISTTVPLNPYTAVMTSVVRMSQGLVETFEWEFKL